MALVLNRQLPEETGQDRVATWMWIGMIPAILGGHYGQKYIEALNPGQLAAGVSRKLE